MKNWETYADKWLPKVEKEFKSVDESEKKPVFVTAERIMKFLVNKDFRLPKAEVIYSEMNQKLIFINASDNKLNRKLIAFYRHSKYNLEKNENYRKLLESYLR